MEILHFMELTLAVLYLTGAVLVFLLKARNSKTYAFCLLAMFTYSLSHLSEAPLSEEALYTRLGCCFLVLPFLLVGNLFFIKQVIRQWKKENLGTRE